MNSKLPSLPNSCTDMVYGKYHAIAAVLEQAVRGEGLKEQIRVSRIAGPPRDLQAMGSLFENLTSSHIGIDAGSIGVARLETITIMVLYVSTL